jgi:hypothetical protein
MRRITIVGNQVVSDTAGEIAAAPINAPPASRKRLPLGDYTERLLSSVGVTPDRYTAAKAALGMAPTCNCAKRKAWLNRAGEWLASLGDGD